MHSPETVAFEIKSPFKRKSEWFPEGYHDTILTIWHNDPCKDGTDDSCGWFIRGRHFPKQIVDDITKEFESEWDRTYTGENGYVYNCGWFSPEGDNILSVQGIVLNMYLCAAKIALSPTGKTSPGKMWDRAWKFINKNHVQIMYFAENNTDSMRDIIVRKFERGCNVEYTPKKRTEMIRECASIVAGDILRKSRPWYKHPRWHIHHWSFQFHPWQNFKRRYWDKCSGCGKRGFKTAAIGEWSGNRRWHEQCYKPDYPEPSSEAHVNPIHN